MRQHIYDTWTLIMDSDGRRNNGEHD